MSNHEALREREAMTQKAAELKKSLAAVNHILMRPGSRTSIPEKFKKLGKVDGVSPKFPINAETGIRESRTQWTLPPPIFRKPGESESFGTRPGGGRTTEEVDVEWSSPRTRRIRRRVVEIREEVESHFHMTTSEDRGPDTDAWVGAGGWKFEPKFQEGRDSPLWSPVRNKKVIPTDQGSSWEQLLATVNASEQGEEEQGDVETGWFVPVKGETQPDQVPVEVERSCLKKEPRMGCFLRQASIKYEPKAQGTPRRAGFSTEEEKGRMMWSASPPRCEPSIQSPSSPLRWVEDGDEEWREWECRKHRQEMERQQRARTAAAEQRIWRDIAQRAWPQRQEHPGRYQPQPPQPLSPPPKMQGRGRGRMSAIC